MSGNSRYQAWLDFEDSLLAADAAVDKYLEQTAPEAEGDNQDDTNDTLIPGLLRDVAIKLQIVLDAGLSPECSRLITLILPLAPKIAETIDILIFEANSHQHPSKKEKDAAEILESHISAFVSSGIALDTLEHWITILDLLDIESGDDLDLAPSGSFVSVFQPCRHAPALLEIYSETIQSLKDHSLDQITVDSRSRNIAEYFDATMTSIYWIFYIQDSLKAAHRAYRPQVAEIKKTIFSHQKLVDMAVNAASIYMTFVETGKAEDPSLEYADTWLHIVVTLEKTISALTASQKRLSYKLFRNNFAVLVALLHALSNTLHYQTKEYGELADPLAEREVFDLVYILFKLSLEAFCQNPSRVEPFSDVNRIQSLFTASRDLHIALISARNEVDLDKDWAVWGHLTSMYGLVLSVWNLWNVPEIDESSDGTPRIDMLITVLEELEEQILYGKVAETASAGDSFQIVGHVLSTLVSASSIKDKFKREEAAKLVPVALPLLERLCYETVTASGHRLEFAVLAEWHSCLLLNSSLCASGSLKHRKLRRRCRYLLQMVANNISRRDTSKLKTRDEKYDYLVWLRFHVQVMVDISKALVYSASSESADAQDLNDTRKTELCGMLTKYLHILQLFVDQKRPVSVPFYFALAFEIENLAVVTGFPSSILSGQEQVFKLLDEAQKSKAKEYLKLKDHVKEFKRALIVLKPHMLAPKDCSDAQMDGLSLKARALAALPCSYLDCPTVWKPDGEKPKLCSGCKRVKYCSKECQKHDWLAHKVECKLFCETE